MHVVSQKIARSFERPNDDHWLDRLLSSVEIPQVDEASEHAVDAAWGSEQASALIQQVRRTINEYMPWLLPEFATLHADSTLASHLNCDSTSLAQMPECIEQLRIKLEVGLSLGMEAHRAA